MHIKTLNDENDFSILTNSPAVDLRVDSDHLLQTATHADLMRYILYDHLFISITINAYQCIQ